MNPCFLSKDIVSGILEDGMPFALSLCMMLPSDDFCDIWLNYATPSVIDSVNSSLFNSGAALALLRFGRGPVNNIGSFLKARDGVTLWVCLLVPLPTGSGFIHSFFAGDLVFFSIFCDKLVPGFRHLLFCLMDIKTQCQQEDGLHT